jgi:ABC exporter DevB family membrane fusion protein
MSQVLAPTKGKILSIMTRKGETIAQRPVLRLGDVSQMVCKCEVYETQVWSIAVGQSATINSRALAMPLHGRVTFIGQLVAKNDVMSIDPSKSSDNRVVEVHVDIEEDAEAARLVNLQVDVVIDTKATSPQTEPPAAQLEQAAKT